MLVVERINQAAGPGRLGLDFTNDIPNAPLHVAQEGGGPSLLGFTDRHHNRTAPRPVDGRDQTTDKPRCRSLWLGDVYQGSAFAARTWSWRPVLLVQRLDRIGRHLIVWRFVAGPRQRGTRGRAGRHVARRCQQAKQPCGAGPGFESGEAIDDRNTHFALDRRQSFEHFPALIRILIELTDDVVEPIEGPCSFHRVVGLDVPVAIGRLIGRLWFNGGRHSGLGHRGVHCISS